MSDKAATYCSIGKRISCFLDTKTYELNRTARINVSSDKVCWSLTNKLSKSDDGGYSVDSDLRVAHDFDSETVSVTSSTSDAPTFTLKSKRFSSKFNCVAKVQDPNVALKFCRRQSKYALCLDTSYNWDGGAALKEQDKDQDICDASFAATYAGLDKFLIGGKVKVVRRRTGDNTDETINLIDDFNVGVQFDRNDDQCFALTTENSMQKVNVGARFKVRECLQGFAKVSYDMSKDGDGNPVDSPLGYAVGLNKKLKSNANLRAVYRDDKTMSVMYSNNFQESNICAKLGCNFNLAQPRQPANLEWKIIFGTNSKCCQNNKK